MERRRIVRLMIAAAAALAIAGVFAFEIWSGHPPPPPPPSCHTIFVTSAVGNSTTMLPSSTCTIP